jgi:hypothetical protein
LALATDSKAKPSPDQAEAVLVSIMILQEATAGLQAGRCEANIWPAPWHRTGQLQNLRLSRV